MSIQLEKSLQDEILTQIAAVDKDDILYMDKSFVLRQRAIDHIEFHVIDRIDAFMQNTGVTDVLISLKEYAYKVKHQIEEADGRMFTQLRENFLTDTDNGKLLMRWISEYIDDHVTAHDLDPKGYLRTDIKFAYHGPAKKVLLYANARKG
jgi:hypothetical protein